MSDTYILDKAGNPVAEPDIRSWATWFEHSQQQRIVENDEIGGSVISTVFLGLDHSFGEGKPILWETLVFGGKLNGETDRCGGSRDDAIAMHKKMAKRVKESL